jgi:catechol 2,3-dioxygenase-like lactoylglutathione lyase family enzyme
MKLEFLLIPTNDLTASLAFYRDGLGFTELWREGDSTAAISLVGSETQIMLDSTDPDAAVGPIFVVDSVQKFHLELPSNLAVVDEPAEIPGGFMATYRESGGTTLYVLDQSTEDSDQ